MLRGANLSLALNEPKQVAPHSIQTFLQACITLGKKLMMWYAKQPIESCRRPTPEEKSN